MFDKDWVGLGLGMDDNGMVSADLVLGSVASGFVTVSVLTP
jgi:hypothetical protein